MGADWSHPVLADNYSDVLLVYLNGKDIDALTLQKTAPSNLPDGAIAYDRSTDLFKEWDGVGLVFVTKVLSIAGGGTGAASAGAARTSLGLGSMSTQDSSAVSITGGSISGITLNASAITAGVIALARGGTGASLSLGASGTFLQSNGAAIVFGSDGSILANLNASNLASGTVPNARINGALLTNLNASNIASGTVPLARLPSGLGGIASVAQVTTSAQVFVSGSYTSIGLSITVTPLSSSNRVILMATLNGFLSPGNTQMGCGLFRNGSLLFDFARVGDADSAAGANAYDGANLNYVDSPATTSATVYEIKVYFYSGSFGGIFQNGSHGNSYLIATEITV